MSEAQRPASTKPLWRHPLTRLGLSLLVLALLASVFPPAELWSSVKRVPLSLWTACLLLFVAGHAVAAFKWRLLISAGAAPIPYPVVFRCHFAGLFGNLFLPSIAGGDLVRAGLALRNTASRESVILGSLVDRLIDTLALVLLVLVGALVSGAALDPGEARLVGLTALLLVLGAVAGALGLILPLPRWIPAKLLALRDRARRALLSLLHRPGRALAALVLSLTIQAGFVGLNALLGGACGIELGPAVWLMVWPLAKLAAMAPVSLGGLGVREAALAVLLGRFAVPGSDAVGLGLVWDTILIGGGLFGGLFYVAVRRRAAEGV